MSDDKKSWWMQTPVIVGSITALIAAPVSLVTAVDKTGWVKPKTAPARVEVAAEAPASPSSTTKPTPASPQAQTLRRDPQLLKSADVDVALVRLGLFDALRNPAGPGIANQFEIQIRDGVTEVLDHSTGLTWMRDISATQTAEGAAVYVRELRDAQHAGYTDWRIPTLEEALSLMEPLAVNGVHLDLSLQRKIFATQTSDTAIDDRKWIVYYAHGHTSPEPRDFFAPVLAVRGEATRTATEP